MWMTTYIQAIQRHFIDELGYSENPDKPGTLLPNVVPDGTYPMMIDGKLDNVKIVDGGINCCNFEEEDA